MKTKLLRLTNFGKYLRERRVAWGFTQRSLGSKVGVVGAHIAFLESGRRRPSLKLLSRLADVLEVDRQEMLLMTHPEAKGLLGRKRKKRRKKRVHYGSGSSVIARYSLATALRPANFKYSNTCPYWARSLRLDICLRF
jgi:transcriptional regulator with XRE-family HTH domain